MPKLPNADRAIIEERKITDYLLCETHEEGGPKAKFFKSFGWSSEEPDLFATALRRHATEFEVARAFPAPHGEKFEIIGAVAAPNGSNVVIKTVWIILFGEDRPRLVTAVPA